MISDEAGGVEHHLGSVWYKHLTYMTLVCSRAQVVDLRLCQVFFSLLELTVLHAHPLVVLSELVGMRSKGAWLLLCSGCFIELFPRPLDVLLVRPSPLIFLNDAASVSVSAVCRSQTCLVAAGFTGR